MGSELSQCMGKRKKEVYITAIKLDREDSNFEPQRSSVLLNQRHSQAIAIPKTPINLLFPPPPAVPTASTNTARSVLPQAVQQEKQELKEEKNSSEDQKEERIQSEGLSDITSRINNRENKSLIAKPPNLKKINKLDNIIWSPIKQECSSSEPIISIPVFNSKQYFQTQQ